MLVLVKATKRDQQVSLVNECSWLNKTNLYERGRMWLLSHSFQTPDFRDNMPQIHPSLQVLGCCGDSDMFEPQRLPPSHADVFRLSTRTEPPCIMRPILFLHFSGMQHVTSSLNLDRAWLNIGGGDITA